MTLLFKKYASNEDWTHDLWFTRPTLCHWAIEAPDEWLPLTVQQNCIGDTRIWTMDLSDCSRLLYHWAISPRPRIGVWSTQLHVDTWTLEHLCFREHQCQQGVGGIMVSIAAFQAVDPGSIPGRRNIFVLLLGSQASKLCNRIWPNIWISKQKFSVTGNWTRATWVRARYPNH